MILPIITCKFDATEKQMHLNTSPTSLEGLRELETRKKKQNLKNYKLAPKLQPRNTTDMTTKFRVWLI